jgi:hypothetical protein
MLRHHQIQGVLCAAFAAAGLLLTSCTQDRIEPAPVSFRGVNRTMNSSGPVVVAPLPAPRAVTASPPPAAAPSRAHRAMPMEHASGGAAIKGKRSAGAQKVHRHRAPPQMAGSVSAKAKVHRAAKSATSAIALARSHRESIPLDEPVTRSAEPVPMHPAQTPPAWVRPAPVDVPQTQFRAPVP